GDAVRLAPPWGVACFRSRKRLRQHARPARCAPWRRQRTAPGETNDVPSRRRSGSAGSSWSSARPRNALSMNFASTALLALAMSADAFAAAVGKGSALHDPRWREALRTGLIFGVIEGTT